MILHYVRNPFKIDQTKDAKEMLLFNIKNYLQYYPLRVNPAKEIFLYIGEVGRGKNLQEVYARFSRVGKGLILLTDFSRGNIKNLAGYDSMSLEDLQEIEKIVNFHFDYINENMKKYNPYYHIKPERMADERRKYNATKNNPQWCFAREFRNKYSISD